MVKHYCLTTLGTHLEVWILVSVLLEGDGVVLHDMCADGAAAIGGLAADSALVGALVPPVVFDRTESPRILCSSW